MSSGPRVSVLLPVRDEERYLVECLDSLSAQTLADFEVIVVDDGSTDASAAIAAEHARADPRFRLVCQELALGAVSGPDGRARVRALAAGLGLVEGKDFVAVA